ncbi:DUF3379 domain-containing protein [Shewanella sp. SR43-4]|jgi:hypothetical protein|uniref:DUF3379 domain-containing protein n=1 Tax=Shewanella TaxID=22 RepID=UPI000F4F84EE|nr:MULTISPECIES: DUF3379 domain-containing protein [Shewanella]MBB1318295.1 DUF3379 domain-containing protein [Shewanella sp. SR43-4]RPA51163.1 DUF3379 domain-containing protein [Shewanella vesiculosa]UJL43044.1 DUF3379 domain-containing protein [Shewanella vesiculosa]|tara:strand:+ start:1065 stop:1772 length:708 start_codon:yes stop_codon:yes gene_type:complete
MDDLQFRRQAYGDPNNQSDEFLTHLAEHEDDAKFIKDLKAFDHKLMQALNISVPDDLADKLILRQQLSQHQQSKKHTRYMMAMAASVAFIVGVSFSLLRFTPVNLSENSLAHVHHETKALIMEQDIGFNDVNFKLASVDGLSDSKFIKQPGRVFFTSYCDFQGVKSLHLVMADENGNKVTLFIVPIEKRIVLEEAFADNQYKGQSFQTADAYMVLVGEPASNLEFVKKEVENTFI